MLQQRSATTGGFHREGREARDGEQHLRLNTKGTGICCFQRYVMHRASPNRFPFAAFATFAVEVFLLLI
jgi:hypothetical protein